MKQIRIAYIINSVEGGGAASPVPAIAKVLRSEGAEVRLFALTGRNRRALPAIEQAGLDPLVREGGEKDHIAATLWLIRQAREWNATHLWTSLSRATLLGLIAGPRLGLPVICWQHNAFLKPWNERLLRMLQSRALLWVADSRSVADLTASRLGVEPERLATWPIFFADTTAPVSRPWQAGETIRIGSLGRLHPAKGYDILIAALAQLKAQGFVPPVPVDIDIRGEGAERSRLETLAGAAGLDNLRFAGFCDDPPGFLAGLHLYVQPSRREGFCIAAHQALTAGLPVIASSVGELAYSITDGRNGYRVPPEDVGALADALALILRNPGGLYAMGQAARADVLQHFSEEKFAQAGAAIMKRVKAASADLTAA